MNLPAALKDVGEEVAEFGCSGRRLVLVECGVVARQPPQQLGLGVSWLARAHAEMKAAGFWTETAEFPRPSPAAYSPHNAWLNDAMSPNFG